VAWYWMALLSTKERPNLIVLDAGREALGAIVRTSFPKPLPNSTLGVRMAQQLPLPFLPVGMLAERVAVRAALW